MKTTRTLFVVACAALAAISCQKQAADSESADKKLVPMSFTVSVAQDDAKSRISDNTVLWVTGDELSIFDQNDNMTKFIATGSGSKVTFTGSVAEDANEFYALYPYDEDATISEGVITFTTPTEQVVTAAGVADKCNYAVGYSAGSAPGDNMVLHNVMGYIKFTVAAADDIRSVELLGLNNENVAGTATVKVSGGTVGAAAGINGKCSKTTKISSATAMDGTYYLVCQQRKFSKGFQLTFTNGDGAMAVKKGTKSVTVHLNEAVNVGTISGLEWPLFYDNFDWATGAENIWSTTNERTYTSWPSTEQAKWSLADSNSGAFTRSGYLRVCLGNKGTGLITSALSSIKGTQDIKVTFDACQYISSAKGTLDSFHEIHVSAIDGGTVEGGDFDTASYPFNSSNSTTCFGTFSCVIRNATASTKVQFLFGPQLGSLKTVAHDNSGLAPAIGSYNDSGNTSSRTGFDNVKIELLDE